MGYMNNFGDRGGGFQMGGPLSSGRMSVPGTGMGMDMHRIPIIGNMFDNPYDKFKQQQMQNAAQAYSMYRPEAMQGAMNAMNMQSSSLQPVNNALAAMYGSGATQGFQAQNPFGATAFTRGAAAGQGLPPRSPRFLPSKAGAQWRDRAPGGKSVGVPAVRGVSGVSGPSPVSGERSSRVLASLPRASLRRASDVAVWGRSLRWPRGWGSSPKVQD
jgi:hypothetical protein